MVPVGLEGTPNLSEDIGDRCARSGRRIRAENVGRSRAENVGRRCCEGWTPAGDVGVGSGFGWRCVLVLCGVVDVSRWTLVVRWLLAGGRAWVVQWVFRALEG